MRQRNKRGNKMKAIQILYSKALTPILLELQIIPGLYGSYSTEAGLWGLHRAVCITEQDNGTNEQPIGLNTLKSIAMVCDTLYTDIKAEPLDKDPIFAHFKIKRLND